MDEPSTSDHAPNGLRAFFLKRAFKWAVLLAALAILAYVLTIYYSQMLPWIVTAFLGFLSIIISAFAGVLLSREQLRDEISDYHEKRLGSVTSISATELNNFYTNVASLNKTWSQICKQYNIPGTTFSAVSDRLFNMMNIIQSSINTILVIGGSKHNPFKLLNFANETKCPHSVCGKNIKADSLSPFPRGETLLRCEQCGTNVHLKRRSDGSIQAQIAFPPAVHDTHIENRRYKPPTADAVAEIEEQLKNLAPSRPKREPLLTRAVQCPNPDCNREITILCNSFFSYANRGCPHCKTVFTYVLGSGLIELKKTNHNKVVKVGDIVTDVFGVKKVKCGCGKVVGTKYLQKNDLGEWYLNCHNCGSIMIDESALLVDS